MRTDDQLKNLRHLAGHLHQYRAVGTPQHARQTPLLSVQSERLQGAPTMAEGCTPKTEIRRGAKSNRLLNHSSRRGKYVLNRWKSVLSGSLNPRVWNQRLCREEIKKSLTIALLTSLQLPITTIAVAFPNTLDGGLARPQMTTPAFLVELKAMGLKDLYHIQGFMRLLMKPRNGMPWTAEDKAAIRLHLKSVAASLPMLAVFTLPGGLLLLPLLAWHLDRRKQS